MLAVGELFVSANGRLSVWELGAGRFGSRLCSLRFGESRRPAEFVPEVQAVWAPLDVIVGSFALHFDLCGRVSLTRGAASPIGATVSVRRGLQR